MTRKPRNKHAKLELVFDSKQRQEFLTGFSKRKQARKKAARDQLEQRYKDEVARIKKEKREQIKKRLEEVASVKKAEGIDLAELARNELDKEKILDLPQHVVTITSTEELDLTKSKENLFPKTNYENCVEIMDVSDEDGDESKSNAKPSGEKTKASHKKSKAKVAELARKAQSLKSKKHHRNNITNGKISKSQKKFLKKKKGGRRKDRSSR